MRKRLTLAAMALAAMALMGGSASTAAADQPVEVWDSGLSEPCPELFVIENYLAGGCEINDAEGAFELDWYFNNWSTYGMKFDLRVGPEGTAYAYDQEIAQPMYPPHYYPCDTEDGTKVLWPVQFTLNDNDEWKAKMTLKLRYWTQPTGGSCTMRIVPFSMDINGVGSADLAQSAAVDRIRNAWWSFSGSVAEFIG